MREQILKVDNEELFELLEKNLQENELILSEIVRRDCKGEIFRVIDPKLSSPRKRGSSFN